MRPKLFGMSMGIYVLKNTWWITVSSMEVLNNQLKKARLNSTQLTTGGTYNQIHLEISRVSSLVRNVDWTRGLSLFTRLCHKYKQIEKIFREESTYECLANKTLAMDIILKDFRKSRQNPNGLSDFWQNYTSKTSILSIHLSINSVFLGHFFFSV